MTMFTKGLVATHTTNRRKMVRFLNACIPELRKVAQTLELKRKADGTLNNRDKDGHSETTQY